MSYTYFLMHAGNTVNAQISDVTRQAEATTRRPTSTLSQPFFFPSVAILKIIKRTEP